MIVGVPKEIKNHEYRVGLTPMAAQEYIMHGHSILIEAGAGVGSSFPDADYIERGCEIIDTAPEIFECAEMIVKVKEPQPHEIAMLREGQILYTYLHLAPDDEQTQGLIGSKAVCVAYETVEKSDGSLPLLAPMSEVAGRMSAQIGATLMQKNQGGRGVLMGGVPGVETSHVLVLGGGVVGMNAAYIAKGMGASVTIMDLNIDRLRYITDCWGHSMHTMHSSTAAIMHYLPNADLVIGAVLVPGGRTPNLITRDMLKLMKPGAVIVDVAVDQGGCIETTHATTHADPTYLVDGVLHYGVANMPGAVPNTSTRALNNATMPYGLALADKGWKQAMRDDAALALGANVVLGKITCAGVAEAQGLELTPLADFF